jgi:lipoate-protein ligase A
MIYCHRHYSAAPDFNMGFDEWLLHSVVQKPQQLHFRLYSWSEGTITIGRNQQLESAVDLGRVGDTPVIRRVTGGRALFHDPSEITYAVAWDMNSCPSASLRQQGTRAHRSLSEALVSFLNAIQIPAAIVRSSAPRNARPGFFHKAPCFASHARWEIASEGQKVVASAARRYGSAVLQHGAIKLRGAAAHPALDPRVSAAQRLRRIGNGEFDRLAETFECELLKCLGVDSEDRQFGGLSSAVNERELRQFVDYVKKNRTEQRDIFERRLEGESLYRGGARVCRQKRA